VAVYRDYDRPELDRQYSPSSLVPGLRVFLDSYARTSEAARTELPVRSALRYGPTPRETIDFFPAAGKSPPLLVFVHGGYWQELSKEDSAFPARDLVPAGVAFAALGYGLAPEHRLGDIVEQVARGLAWLTAHTAELGVGRVHVAGHCAGAHLVASALAAGVTGCASAILLSGVYDLEPLRLTYVNEPLGLDSAEAGRLSPIRHLPDRLPPLVVARGGAETEEFARQHAEFVAAARSRTPSLDDLVIGHRNHFDIPYDLGARATALGAAVFNRLEAPHNGQGPDVRGPGGRQPPRDRVPL
jgi:arylformamidase